MKLNLIVLRSEQIESLADFYEALLEVQFAKHRHGNGPEHMGAELGDVFVEIYPKRNSSDSTTPIRIGFMTTDIIATLDRIANFSFKVIAEPKDTEWGKRMVLDDPEGHRIELTQPSP